MMTMTEGVLVIVIIPKLRAKELGHKLSHDNYPPASGPPRKKMHSSHPFEDRAPMTMTMTMITMTMTFFLAHDTRCGFCPQSFPLKLRQRRFPPAL